jgi:hypothetical protein
MPTGKKEKLSAFCLGKLKKRDHLEDTGPAPSILLLRIWELRCELD